MERHLPKDLLVEAHHKLWWEANVQLAIQRHGSKLRPYVTEKPDQGEGAVAANLIQPVRAIRDTGRRRSNISLTAERKRRWLIYRDPIAVGACIDAEDTFRQVGEPTSELIENGAKAIGRGIDGRILGLNQDGAAGILGSIIEGKRPGAAGIALPAGNIALHGGAGRGCAPPGRRGRDGGALGGRLRAPRAGGSEYPHRGAGGRDALCPGPSTHPLHPDARSLSDARRLRIAVPRSRAKAASHAWPSRPSGRPKGATACRRTPWRWSRRQP